MTTIGNSGSRLFGRIVNIVGRAIGQFQIEEEKIEFLLLQSGDRFLDGANDDATKADLLEENLKQALQASSSSTTSTVGCPDLSSFKISLSSEDFLMRQRPPIWMAGSWPRCTR